MLELASVPCGLVIRINISCGNSSVVQNVVRRYFKCSHYDKKTDYGVCFHCIDQSILKIKLKTIEHTKSFLF